LINETSLGHRDFENFVGLGIDFFADANSKEVLYFSFIFQLVFLLQGCNDIVNGSIFMGKEETIISVDNNNAIIMDKEAGIDFGQLKTFINEALATMLKPIIGSLLNAIEVLLQFDTVLTIIGPGIGGLHEVLFLWIKVPSLWKLQEDVVIKGSLWESLDEINLSGFEIENG
jgi:hypothetical protein